MFSIAVRRLIVHSIINNNAFKTVSLNELTVKEAISN